MIASEPLEAWLRQAQRDGHVSGPADEQLVAQGLRQGLLTKDEHDLLQRAAALCRCANMVDNYPVDLRRNAIPRSLQAIRGDARARFYDHGNGVGGGDTC